MVRTQWAGKDAQAPRGTYTWTLTATPADGVGATLTRSGDLKVIGTSTAWHDFDGADGIGDILDVASDGTAYIFPGKGDGGLGAKRLVGTDWPRASTLVPFGDMTGDGDGDGDNDVVGLDPEGRLLRYDGTGEGTLTGRTQIGAGWSGHTVS
ncbi:hypothetical protein [Streptomyces sp. SM11]|uniref:hypothetical protein n=1 Tax=Streptomyces sp. SM11 TaxID=565557 RepID=UPI000CD4AB6E|nr:hypothetical protein [Streptomyces sp. SM11]